MPDYVSTYIQHALKDPTSLEPPDATQTNGHLEVLESLYLERGGGLEAVQRAWDISKRLIPELAALEKPSTRRSVPFDDLEDVQPPPYAEGRYPIYEKGFNLIYGQPGSGKSFVALDLGARIAHANPDKPVIYCAGEGHSDLALRWRAWKRHNQVTAVGNFHFYPEALQFSRKEKVQAFLEEHPVPYFIIVDTFARAMVGINENDQTAVGVFVDRVDELRRELRFGILFVHHVNRLGGIRGSTALDGALDSMLKIEKQERQHIIYNSLDKGGKNKYREEAKPLYFHLLPVDLGLLDDDGNPIETPAVELSDRIIDQPAAGSLTDSQQQILEVIDGFDTGVSPGTIIDATQISRPTVFRNLGKLKKAGYIQQDTSGQYLITGTGRNVLSR